VVARAVVVRCFHELAETVMREPDDSDLLKLAEASVDIRGSANQKSRVDSRDQRKSGDKYRLYTSQCWRR